MVLSLVTSAENQSPRDESSRDSEDDSPVDLRKRCVIDRQCLPDKRKPSEKNQSSNFVLTSLLQKKSSHSLSTEEHHKYGHENDLLHSRKQKDYSELETRLRQPRPTTPEYLNSFRTKCDDSLNGKIDKEPSFLADRLLMPAPLPLKLHPTQNPFAMKRQFCLKLQHLEEPCDYKDTEATKSVSFRSQRDGGAFRSVGNYDRNTPTNERNGPDGENRDFEKEPKEFVPNYRKFYSRCSNKAKISEKKDNSHRDMSDYVPAVNNSDSTPMDDEDIRLKVRNISILKRSSSCSLVFPNHSVDDDDNSRLNLSGFSVDSDVGDAYESEDQRQGLKRRLTLPLRSSSAAPKSDLTLRCLLQAPPAEKRVRSLEFAASCENSLYANFDSLHSYLSNNEKTQGHHQHHKGIFSDRRVVTPDDYLRAVNKYYLQVFHNFSGLPVLQRLLSDTGSKTGGHRPPISPDSPMSTSPGSESTTSGSTDSGVFSDLAADDAGRKRVSRALTGKHVRSGTGASPSTLRTLRQMIEDRRKMKILCKT